MRGIRSLNNLSKRCYAAARPNEALTESDTGYKSSGVSLPAPQNVQVSKLPNGLVIASLENYSPLSTVGVFVKAGSRYESVENQGVAHVLRLAANLTTKGVSAFKLCRGVEALGANLRSGSLVLAKCLSDKCKRDPVCALGHPPAVLRCPEKPWSTPHAALEITCVIEKLHEAAYKNTLSNSLYCPEHMVGKVSPQQLHSFVEDHFTTGRMAVVGLGVKHSDLTELSKRFLSVRVGAGAPLVQATYRELRVQNQDSQVHALVVSEGGVAGGTEATAFAVLQKILGVEPHVKRGTGITSKLSQGVTKASAFNASYSDSGLFGVYTISQANVARDAIRVAIAQVGSVAEGTVTEDDITRAKIQAKVDYLLSTESSDGLMAEIGAQALETAAYRPPEAVLQAIDAVTQEHVVKAARKFMDGKKTMAACGHLINTPFLDEL
ncbi:ubiquinol-cytochrome c reductase core protein 2a isoform X2 [Syngnathus scovelli]|uniref:ubiquinol-cytochrome c reductase core protein 2a isoform X2 n=1 Tax=Syngnathus scovelli TaxID=161590 RepID=UPI00210FD846|nr:cytochrome b-c1 complex subunit 2, mitochondrial isoform X2 [Syngnathus scovelli]